MASEDRNYRTPSFSIPEQMLETLETIAHREDRSVSSVVRRAVRLYVGEYSERQGVDLELKE